MSPRIYNIIVSELINEAYFKEENVYTGKMGLAPSQNLTAALRILAYGTKVDSVGEYIYMSFRNHRTETLRSVLCINY